MAYYDDGLDAKTALKRRQPGQVPGQPGTPQAPAAYSTTGGVGDAQSQLPAGQSPAVTPGAHTAPAQSPTTPSPDFGAGQQPQRTPIQTFDPDRPPTPDDLPGFPRPPRELPAPGVPTETAPAPAPPPPPEQPAPQSAPLTANDRDRFMQIAQQYPHTPEGLDQLIRDNPELGIVRDGKGDIRLADGTYIDVILAAGLGGQGWQWLNDGMGGQGGQAQPSMTSGMPTLGSLTSNLSAAGLTSFQEQMRAMILQQLAGAAQPVDPSSPEIRLPINDVERRAEEVRRRRQSADAERLTQRGIGDSGALDTARRQGFEDMSQTISGVTAQIIGEQMQNKKRELITLLQTAMASGDAESARQVQMQLAGIDAELRKMGLRQQNDQFYAGQRQQQGQFDSALDLDWARFDTDLLG